MIFPRAFRQHPFAVLACLWLLVSLGMLAAARPALDDFAFIVLSQEIAHPWGFFYTDHFFGSLYFRPLAMAFWWLSIAVVGTNFPAQVGLNLVVLALIVTGVYRLGRQGGLRRLGSALVATAVMVHPITMATSLWLSDRFDLLSLAFGVWAIYVFWVEVARGSWAWRALLLCVAAMLCKELSVIYPITLAMVAIVPSLTPLWRWSKRLAHSFVFCAVFVGFLAGRGYLLSGVNDGYLFADGELTILIKGSLILLRQLPTLIVASLPGGWWAAGLILGLAVALTCFVWRNERAGKQGGGSRQRLFRLLSSAALLAAGSVAVQSPVGMHGGVEPLTAAFSFGVAFDARLYFTALVWVLLSLAALAALSRQPWRSACSALLSGFLLLSLPLWLVFSVQWMHWYTDVTRQFWQQRLVPAAMAVAEHDDGLKPGCQIYLLDVPTMNQGFGDFSDSMVKSMLPLDAPARACFIQTERTPWFYIMPRTAEPFEVAPLHFHTVGGEPIPVLQFDTISYYYLNAWSGMKPTANNTLVLRYQPDGGYDDVTEQIDELAETIDFRQVRDDLPTKD